MCVEFYLLTRLAGATKSLLWKLIFASTWMVDVDTLEKLQCRQEQLHTQ